jgi:hypothetical protein
MALKLEFSLIIPVHALDAQTIKIDHTEHPVRLEYRASMRIH